MAVTGADGGSSHYWMLKCRVNGGNGGLDFFLVAANIRP